MSKIKTEYECSHCNQTYGKWQGNCTSCGEWNTIVEVTVAPTSVNTKKSAKRIIPDHELPKPLKDVSSKHTARIETGNSEMDRVLGGGIVPDGVYVLAAPPGQGKSTLLLGISNNMATAGHTVLYVSGEESESQIKSRGDRICKVISDNLFIKHEKSINRIEAYIEALDPTVIILDSMQTLFAEEITDSMAGNPKQVNEVTARIVDISKNRGKKRAHFICNQMTKDDEMMGTRTLEHAVDGVFYLEGERNEQLRILTARKNRFGDTGETGLFIMEAEGLIPLDNPSAFFVTQREGTVPGSALTVTKEGTRNIIVEIESLAEKAFYGFPARIGEGVNKQQLQILTAILEKRGGVTVGERDVYVKVVGGLKLQETAVNLGVLMSIASSVYDKGLPKDTVFVGEVGLTGELKSVPAIEQRIKEVDRLGFKQIVIPKGNLKKKMDLKNVTIIEMESVKDTILFALGEKEKKSKKKEEVVVDPSVA